MRYDGGIMVDFGSKRVLFDPRRRPSRRPDVIAITHAHSDHYNLKVLRTLNNVPKVMSNATLRIMDPKGVLRNVIPIQEREEKEVSGIQFYAYQSGHIVGSLEFLVSHRYEVVYTGDFNLEERIILNPAKILRGDFLIIEATYGDPRYTFPPRSVLYRKILELSKEGKIFAGRRIGVSQELTALLALSKIRIPVVHPSVAEINKVYEKHGELLGPYLVMNDPIEERPYIAPINYSASSDVVRCTGWAMSGGGIPLSSHADFNQLVEYAARSGAEKIFTVYGFAEKFAVYLRSMGLDADSLK